MPAAAGMMLSNTVRLVRPLSRGGMGSVWVADHLTLHTQVVVKFIAETLLRDQDAMARFSREAAAAAQVKSPHVVQMFDHGVMQDGTPYIVMELLDGHDLADELARIGRFAPPVFLKLFEQIAGAIGRAHERGVVHRDIKPENIFLTDIGRGEPFVKVLDFGIAKAETDLSALNQTKTGAIMGTPYYMSPEQLTGKKNLDYRADLWSLGVLAFQALTGARPFDGETYGALALAIANDPLLPMSQVNPALGQAVDQWFFRACARDSRNGRFASAHEMAHALAAALGAADPDARADLPGARRIRAHAGAGHGAAVESPAGIAGALRACAADAVAVRSAPERGSALPDAADECAARVRSPAGRARAPDARDDEPGRRVPVRRRPAPRSPLSAEHDRGRRHGAPHRHAASAEPLAPRKPNYALFGAIGAVVAGMLIVIIVLIASNSGGPASPPSAATTPPATMSAPVQTNPLPRPTPVTPASTPATDTITFTKRNYAVGSTQDETWVREQKYTVTNTKLQATEVERSARRVTFVGVDGKTLLKVKVTYAKRAVDYVATGQKSGTNTSPVQGKTYIVESVPQKPSRIVDESNRAVPAAEEKIVRADTPMVGKPDALLVGMPDGVLHVGQKVEAFTEVIKSLLDNGVTSLTFQNVSATLSAIRDEGGDRVGVFDVAFGMTGSGNGMKLTNTLHGQVEVRASDCRMVRWALSGNFVATGQTNAEGTVAAKAEIVPSRD